MKLRRLLVLLLLPLLLISCAGEHNFTRENGVYTDRATKIAYTALDLNFEAARSGEVVGRYGKEEDVLSLTFKTIPELDSKLFLTDQYYGVYYAGDTPLDPAALVLDDVLLCIEGSLGYASEQLDAERDAETIAALRALWFEGQDGAELPVASDYYKRRVKLTFADYPSLLYCFSFYDFGNEGAYFYDINSNRTVAVPTELAAALRAGGVQS